jgi:hypothetical protein
MHLKKTFAIFILLFACVLTVAAQEKKCALKLAQMKQAPELYGLRLGMTFEQARAVVPSLQAGRTDDLGFATTSFSPEFNPQMNKAAYAGVRTVSLEFLDGKLFMLWIGFNSSYKWKTLEDFVPGMSGALGVPAGAWSLDSAKPRVECEDFEMTAAMIAQGPSIRLTDKLARELWEQRRAEKEEKRSEESDDEPR